jgi:hypothetical protein
MKHGKVPTARQARFIAGLKFRAKYLNPNSWLVVKDTPEIIQLFKKFSIGVVRTWSKKENCWLE